MAIRYPDLNKYREYDAIADAGAYSFRITKDRVKNKPVLDLKTGKMSASIIIAEAQLSALVDLVLDYFEYVENKPELEEF